VIKLYQIFEKRYACLRYLDELSNDARGQSTGAYQVIEKFVKPSGNSGRVCVPRNWIGKRVKVFLLEPIAENEQIDE